MNPILDTALSLAAAGYSVIPVRPDGSKAPAPRSWKIYQTTPADQSQITEWFTDGSCDLAVVQGAVSGGAELAEIEGRAMTGLPDVSKLAADSGLGELWARLMAGWLELSPSGGLHIHYRLADTPVPGNTKLAMNAQSEVLAETRGEGGYVIVAPSSHHPSGKAWQRLAGGPITAPILTPEERGAFHTLLRTMDQTPATKPEITPPARAVQGEGTRPGDDFEAKTSWAEILEPHGWAVVARQGRTTYWRRPGKDGPGISATTGHADDRDRLFVFSTSTEFDTERPYTKFGAYAVLNHGGDMAEAAKQLARDGYGQPSTLPRQADAFAGFLPPQVTPATPGERPLVVGVTEPTSYTLTDDGNALALVDRFGGQVRYVPQRGAWLSWSGARWAWDENGRVFELARLIARDLPSVDRAQERHRNVSLSRRGIESMVALARHDERIVAPLPMLDARPYELNTPGGVVDLSTGTMRAPDPQALHTRSTSVTPDFEGGAPRWQEFLADTFAGNEVMTTYIQRLLGMSMLGVVLEQILPFAHGAGANGKSTLMSTVQHIVGIGDEGYSISAPADMLLASLSTAHPTEIARLAGARFVVTSELEDGERFAESKVKMLTGKDIISGRFMRQDWFSFTPTHTLWLLANSQPEVRNGGPAFWRRLRMLPFEHMVPAEKRIADLEDTLVAQEGPAILAWIINGAVDYLREGLAEPETVSAATDAYAAEQDTVAAFVEDCCVLGPVNQQGMAVRVPVLRGAYEAWCRAQGENPVSAKTLTSQLKARFSVMAAKSMSSRYYKGIHLSEVEAEDHAPRPPEQGGFFS